MFSRLVHAARRLRWPVIIVLLVAGAVAVVLGLLFWSNASTISIPTIQVYSGSVVSVQSDPKFGTHVTLESQKGPSPDIFFDGVVPPTLPEIRVGDQVTIWAEDIAGEWGIKLQSGRGTWVDPIYGHDLNPAPLPPYGLMAFLAMGIGGALILIALVAAYSLYTAAAPVRWHMAAAEVTAAQPAAPNAPRAGVRFGAEVSAPVPVLRAGNFAHLALAMGCAIWLVALIVSGACPLRGVAPLMWLAAMPLFISAAVFARSAGWARAAEPQGAGGGWAWLGMLAIVLAVASGIAIPVGLWFYVFSCLG